MRRTQVSSRELIERLIPADRLDEAGRALLRALAASGDEDELRRGAEKLLERLCELGYARRLSRSEVNGGVRATYRNLLSLDTITINVPREAAPERRPAEAGSRPAAPAVAPGSPVLPTTLLDAVAASSRRIDLAGSLNYLYELLRGSVGCDRAAVFMSKGLAGSTSGKLSELDDVFRWPESEMMAPLDLKTRVETRGDPALVPDLARDGRYGRRFGGAAQGSLIVAPLAAEAYVYGILEVWSRRPGAFGNDELAVVEFVAGFAGGLIKRRLEVEELIFVDQTSQIHNRRYFDEQLSREIERCRRTGSALALLIGDIDDFKRVNDTMGHAAGDSVLRQVGRILSENARQLDIVARFGGEEFAVILPSVTRETALVVAERMRNAVERHEFITGSEADPTCGITMSFGGALYPLDASSRAELIDRADRIALYGAKRQGKNRVVFWQNPSTD
jgi:diguanylate cyclase (GGDEF)-like protein